MWNELSTRHLLALRAVGEEGTFGRAAERLGFTQSAVSQQIAALEALCGQRLFDRPAGPHPPRPTPAGEMLLGHADAILELVAAAEHDLRRMASGVTGSLTIGTFQSISARVLPLTLQRIRLEAPEVEISIVESEAEPIFRPASYEKDDLDLAFVVGDVAPDVGRRFLGADPHVVVAPVGTPDGPVDLVELCGSPMVGQPPSDTCGLLVDRGLERLGLTPHYAFRSHDNGAVQAMVAAGVGMAIMPLLTVDTNDPGITVHTTTPALEPRELSIVWDPQRTLPPVAERFIEIAADVCATQLATLN